MSEANASGTDIQEITVAIEMKNINNTIEKLAVAVENIEQNIGDILRERSRAPPAEKSKDRPASCASRAVRGEYSYNARQEI